MLHGGGAAGARLSAQCYDLRGGDRGRLSLHIIAEQQREATDFNAGVEV